MCGDKALVTAVMRVKPKLMLFGHIHNCKDIENQGVSTYHKLPNTRFSNASCVEDGRFDYGLTSFGNILEVI
jgi:Icc-related predicted phosphoesterase